MFMHQIFFRNVYAIYRFHFRIIFEVAVGAALFWMVLGIFLYKNAIWSWMNRLFLLLSIFGILTFTVFGRKTGSGVPPGRALQDLINNRELIREMVMNAVLFYPFGLCGPYSFAKPSFGAAVKVWIAAVALSVLIESIQAYFHIGVGELSDVIMNSSGAVLGTLSSLAALVIIRRKG